MYKRARPMYAKCAHAVILAGARTMLSAQTSMSLSLRGLTLLDRRTCSHMVHWAYRNPAATQSFFFFLIIRRPPRSPLFPPPPLFRSIFFLLAVYIVRGAAPGVRAAAAGRGSGAAAVGFRTYPAHGGFLPRGVKPPWAV